MIMMIMNKEDSSNWVVLPLQMEPELCFYCKSIPSLLHDYSIMLFWLDYYKYSDDDDDDDFQPVGSLTTNHQNRQIAKVFHEIQPLLIQSRVISDESNKLAVQAKIKNRKWLLAREMDEH